MTFSVLALDRRTGAIGCAAATGNLAVGGWVLRAAAGTGAVATQGFSVSSLWGDDALARLARGEAAEKVVSDVTDPDTGRQHRQLTVLDAKGGVGAWTGTENTDAKGHILGAGFVIAGNWLSNTGVLEDMEQALGHAGQNLGHRLLAALEAGVAAGSDARGTFSAAIRVVRPDQPPLDLRVDYDDNPVARLQVLHDMAESPEYNEWTRHLPTPDHPHRF